MITDRIRQVTTVISLFCLQEYTQFVLQRGENFLYIPPHPRLQPYISNYTLTFPTPNSMSDQYTILPSASSTLVFSVRGQHILNGLNGVSTKACVVGAYANRFDVLLLIEFHPLGLYPFLRVDQHELVDAAVPMDALDRTVCSEIERALWEESAVSGLITALNRIFLAKLDETGFHGTVAAAYDIIVSQKGNVRSRAVSDGVYYSERQLNRLFKQYMGIPIKSFARIVRLNHALRLMQHPAASLAQTAELAAYFDQAHFIHDFKAICGITPQMYLQNASIYYNENFKL